MRTGIVGSILLVLIASGGCGSNAQRAGIDDTLDRFHAAASRADENAYFDCFAPEGVFIGTDATERWTVPAFRAYAHPHFAQGKGWSYRPTQRHVEFAPSGEVAWFDELLEDEKLGTCRGSGVLRRIDGRWRIAQYNLSIPIPNPQAKQVVELIQSHATTKESK